MQKALIVQYDTHAAQKNMDAYKTSSLEELNAHLTQGWQVKSAYPMSGIAGYIAVSLVILEK